MPRRTKVNVTPPAEIKVRKDNGVITEIRKYRVITPLYGGGVEPEKADPITVVRASEIRGHLRFWWRATRGGDPKFKGKLEKMRQREEEIWGAAGGDGKAGPSKVSIRVTAHNEGKTFSQVESQTKHGKKKFHLGDPRSPYSYVAFPLRKTEEKPAGGVRVGVSFEVEIRYPKDNQKDVQAALWAWETFGGIGARTRRGFGALQREGKMISCHEWKRIIEKCLKEYVSSGRWPKGVPHLSLPLKYVITPVQSSPDKAWQRLFKALKNFRQDRELKYIGGKEKPFGRSKWPEPDEIRRWFGPHGHSPGHNPKHPVRKFPRGQFGLPIIFKFKDDNKGDPQQTSLEGHDSDRLASPLILRPLACADGAVGLALTLEWEPLNETDERYTPPGGLVLKGAPGNPHVESQLLPNEAKHIPVLNGQTDVLQAFLDYLKGK